MPGNPSKRRHAARKRKLLEQQMGGQKRMRQSIQVDIPQEAFITALKMES
ncbi:hypothetical protein EU800_13615 [Tropicimonas sp. IMCC6043]|nr:hypothetical protein [Tropicimonas sp. IMCC6043]RYH09013.1 hypothetical protein EU800_13615 [Tropicimonas sp. IMCC6043]